MDLHRRCLALEALTPPQPKPEPDPLRPKREPAPWKKTLPMEIGNHWIATAWVLKFVSEKVDREQRDEWALDNVLALAYEAAERSVCVDLDRDAS